MKQLSLTMLICLCLTACESDEKSRIGTPQDSDTTTSGKLTDSQELIIDSDGCVIGDWEINYFGDMQAISDISCINGSLKIAGTTFDSLNLPKLKRIGGDLQVQGHSALIDLDGLSNLETLGGSLIIQGNSGILSLTGLERLTSIFSVTIYGNANLETLEGLNNLTWLGTINIKGNPALTTIAALNNITGNVGDITIVENARLENLDGLQFLNACDNFELVENPALLNLSPLESLVVDDTLTVSGNQQLTDISGINTEESINSITIADNQELSDLDALGTLTHVDRLEISGNPQLLDLQGLQSLGRVSGEMRIESNDGLATLAGLENLVSIASYTSDPFPAAGLLQLPTPLFALPLYSTIAYNSSLASLAALESLTQPGLLNIHDNPLLPYCSICELREQSIGIWGSKQSCLYGNAPDTCGDAAVLDYDDLRCPEPTPTPTP